MHQYWFIMYLITQMKIIIYKLIQNLTSFFVVFFNSIKLSPSFSEILSLHPLKGEVHISKKLKIFPDNLSTK